MKININKIYNIDCKLIMKNISDGSIDLIVTDPPYRMSARGSSGLGRGMLKKKIVSSGKVFKHNDIKPKDYIPDFYRILKANAHCYIMTNDINLQEILNVATEVGFHFIKSL